jgi:thiamine-phosphate pyrophosphorylase
VSSGGPDERRLTPPILMLVTDRALAHGLDALVRMVEDAAAAGVNAVQVREKDLPDAEQESLARRIVQAVGASAFVTVNGTPAVAMAAGAPGVHGGEESPAVEAMGRDTHGRLLVGRSVHDLPGAVAAEEAGADYLVLGTIFPSRSHPGGPTGGLARVRQVTDAVRVPVIAIGGITADNLAGVIRAGAAGVAVISAILGQPDARAAARGLREALNAAWQERRDQRQAAKQEAPTW